MEYGLKKQLEVAAEYYEHSIALIEKDRSDKPNLRYRDSEIRAYQGAAEIAIKQEKYQVALKFIEAVLRLQNTENAFRKAKFFELRGDVFRSL